MEELNSNEKTTKRSPLTVRLTEDEWQTLNNLQQKFGDSTQSQVIKRLLAAAKVRRSSIQFADNAELS